MKRAIATGLLTSAIAVVVACSGSSSFDIPPSSGADAGDAGGPSSEDAGCTCAPAPAGCVGTGACSCAPYDCPDSGADAGRACTWSKDDPCGPGMFCLSASCGPGRCVPRVRTDRATRNPVCGCDGITYWNEAIAVMHGMSVRKNNACGNDAVTCGGLGVACPDGASCNYRQESELGCGVSDVLGACWRMPAECPSIAVGVQTKSCEGDCQDECKLIKQQKRFFKANDCPQ